MARKKTKGTVQNNKRVRFCSLDYYRYCCTGIASDIDGIKKYYCTSNGIEIDYENGQKKYYTVVLGEKQLKDVVKIINSYIRGTGDGTQQ